MPAIDVLYRDEYLIAIHKPAGIHVHRTELSRGEPAITEVLAATIGIPVFPLHRLDRPTSGVLLFALSTKAASILAQAFRERRIEKTYWAFVRGWVEPQTIDYPVKVGPDRANKVDALTHLVPLENWEFPWAWHGFETFRASLIEVNPFTGRWHQIRQHCDHIRHPILGDSVWGDTRLNVWLREAGQVDGLQLFCRRLRFSHPITCQEVCVTAPLRTNEIETLERLRSASISTRRFEESTKLALF